MSDQPLVSIIIPTYNRAHLIGETLDSILAQTYQNWECIVVDDGSTDNTDNLMAEYMAKDARFKYYHRPKERLPGGNAARNYGFEVSNGEFIQWFDSDDLMKANFLEIKINFLTTAIDMLICDGWFLFPNKKVKKIGVEVPSDLYKDYILWNVRIFTPSILFRKSFLNTNKLFDEEILKGQESEFFSRLFFKIKTHQYKIISIPLYYYRRHNDTKSEGDKIYNFAFKYSTAKNHITNYKRSIQLEDAELTKYFYKKTLKVYYSAYENKDAKTYKYILYELSKLFKNRYIIHFLKVKYFVKLSRYNNYLNKKLFNHLKYNSPQHLWQSLK